MTLLQPLASHKARSLNYINLKANIINTIPILTALLVDETLTPKSVRTAVFEFLRDLSKDDTLKEERIIENATRYIIQTLEDRNPNRRWMAVEWLSELSELPDLHDRLQETIPQLISCLSDKDPVVRLSAVETLAVFAGHGGKDPLCPYNPPNMTRSPGKFHDIIISQVTPVLDLLANNNNNPDPSMQHNVAQVFIECVKYSSSLHEIVILALPRFKQLLCSPSAFLRSSALKMLEKCAVFPSFHSLIITTTQEALSEIGQLNLSPTAQNQKFLQKLEQHADLDYLRGVSSSSIEVYIGRANSWEKHVRILSMDVLEKLASVGPLAPSFSTKIVKLLSNLGGFDPEILLELLDSDVSKYSSIRKLIIANLQTLINVNFLSLAQYTISSFLSSKGQYPNVRAIERVSRYPYILHHPALVLQNSIPEFVKRALEGDRQMLLVVVELLKNETLHESFSDSVTLALVLQTAVFNPQSDDSGASESRKQYQQFIDRSINFAHMPLTQAAHRTTLSILECSMLSLESQKNNDSLSTSVTAIDRPGKKFGSESDLIIQCRVKDSRRDYPDKRAMRSRYSDFQNQFEPPVMRVLVEYMKRPVLYTALRSLNTTSTEVFSLPSLLLFHLNRNNPNFDWKILSMWIYTIRELFNYDMYPHLYQDLVEVVKIIRNSLFSGFTGPAASRSAPCRLSGVLLLGEAIKNELRTPTESSLNKHHFDPNIESSILLNFHGIESALRDNDINVRIAAIRFFENIMSMGGETDLEREATYLLPNSVGGVIPKLVEILSDKVESMNVRHLVAKCLEVYAGYNTLHIHLIHTIPSLLTLLRPDTSDENPQIQIIPIVLGILITYGRYATLWSSIRDALADRANISQKKYTIYEPLAVLCADEFETYPFLKQPFLDTIPALFNVLDHISNSKLKEEKEKEDEASPKEDQGKKDKDGKKPEEPEDTGPTLPLQICAMRGMMELMKYPPLFFSSAPTSESTFNDLLTRYAIILGSKVEVIGDVEEEDKNLEKGKDSNTKSPEESGNDQETRMVPTRNKSYEVKTNDLRKSETKPKSKLKDPHPLLRHQVICGLYDYDSSALSHLYVFFLQALPNIVDIIANAVKDSDLMVGRMIDALVHVILERDPGSSKVLVSSLFDMFLNSDSGPESESRRIVLIRIIGALHKSTLLK